MRLVTSGTVHGSAQAPSSKSMMQRAVAAAALSSGTTRILNPSFSDDGRASLRIISALGATVRVDGDTIEITGGGEPTGEPLDCGESGLSIRLFSAIAALHSQELTLLARGSLAKRPMGMIAPTLRDLGARVDSVDGYPPLTISGPIRGGDIVVDGSVSSQFISGLLMALPCCETDSVLRVHALKSAPYVHMTLQMMEEFGVRAEPQSDLSEIRVRGRQRYEATKVTIEGDWSGSAFLLVAGAIAGRVTVNGLRGDSRQADRAIVDALLLAGANVTMSEDSVTAQYSSLRGFNFDLTNCPDLFPPLSALAATCRGLSTLRGVSRLRHKESDRAAALLTELGALGVRIRVDGDDMLIEGGTVCGNRVDSHDDHRIAMACGVLALRAKGVVEVARPECVAKSYPEFFEELTRLQERR